MLTTVPAVLYKTPDGSWDMNKEMKGWEMGGRPEPLPFVDDDVDDDSDRTMDIETAGSRGIFSLQRRCIAFQFRPLVPHSRKEAVSSVKKTSAMLKKAMTDRHASWPKKEWFNKTKPHWRASCWWRGWTKYA